MSSPAVHVYRANRQLYSALISRWLAASLSDHKWCRQGAFKRSPAGKRKEKAAKEKASKEKKMKGQVTKERATKKERAAKTKERAAKTKERATKSKVAANMRQEHEKMKKYCHGMQQKREYLMKHFQKSSIDMKSQS